MRIRLVCAAVALLTMSGAGCESPASSSAQHDAAVSADASDGAAGSDGASPDGPGCTWQGTTYAYGAMAPCSDGCNFGYCSADFMGGLSGCHMTTCSCDASTGSWRMGETFPEGDGCTTCTCSAPCNKAASCPAGKCTFAGKDYPVGDSFPAGDCSTCTCTAQGVQCDVVDPKREYWRSYQLESEAACKGWSASCPANTTPFTNRCGCGCEQSKDCPDWIDVKPPNDAAALLAKCPYSGTY